MEDEEDMEEEEVMEEEYVENNSEESLEEEHELQECLQNQNETPKSSLTIDDVEMEKPTVCRRLLFVSRRLFEHDDEDN